MRRLAFRLCLLLVCVICSTGCARFHPKPLSPSEAATEFEARTLAAPGLKTFLESNLHRKVTPWPPAGWDLQLLTLAAFYYHPDLDVARAQQGVAEAGRMTAGERPNPSIGFAPQYDINAVSGVLPWTLGFTIDVPIETAGKRRLRLDQAAHLSKTARMHIALVAWQVRSRLRSRLLDLYVADQTEAALDRQHTLQGQIASALEQRFAVGEISQPEITDAHLALEHVRAALQEAQQQREETRLRLAEAIGVPALALDDITLSFDAVDRPPAPTDLPSQTLRRQALLNRSDLLGALADYAASQSALQLEIAKQYPDLHLGPGYAWDQGESKWSLGLSLTLPVLNHNQGPIAEAEARRTESAARFSARQAGVLAEMDRAVADYQAALQRLVTADAVLSTQQERRQSVKTLFAAGETDRLALLGAGLELNIAEQARLDALVKAQQALGQLEDAMQRPLEPAAGPKEKKP
jgi:outer membrane protein, heavy metal efflux system